MRALASVILLLAVPLLGAPPAPKRDASRPGDASLEYRRGRLEEALRLFQDAARADPQAVRPLLDAAVVQRDLGKHSLSLALFQQAAALEPGDPDLRAALGWSALRAGDLNTARVAFHAALSSETHHEEGLLGMARLELDSGRPKDALAVLDLMLLLHPHATLGHLLRGRACEAVGAPEGAAKSYEAAVNSDNTFAEARLALGGIYKKLGRAEDAWVQYTKVLNVAPGYAAAAKAAAALRKRLTRTPAQIIPRKRIRDFLPVIRAAEGPQVPALRIGIGTTTRGTPAPKPFIAFLCSGEFEIVDPDTHKILLRGPPKTRWVARRARKGQGYELVDEDGKHRAAFRKVIAVRPVDQVRHSTIFQRLSLAEGTAWESEGDRQLKGSVELRSAGRRGLYLINVVTLEDYIYGVVNQEMPERFPVPALEAQAVIARNHALTSMRLTRTHRKDRYHLCDGQHCQVYSGIAGETAKGRTAVDATRGQVLRYGGRIAYTPYSSNCGGHTQDSGEVKGWTKLPYLLGRKDSQDDAPEPKSPWELDQWFKSRPAVYCNIPRYSHPSHFRWGRAFAASDLAQRVRLRERRFGRLKEVRILRRSVSGNVNAVQFRGTRRNLLVEKESSIRMIFGLGSIRNTAFVIETEFDSQGVPKEFILHGGGWGHSVGLCQYGAVGRAEDGQSVAEILGHYFPGTRIESLGY
ncbi:MAG: hypothetical protein A2X36_11085 [Elusimicrobia bacterium GWA2_69_24]|nr:MAG: hypothetical protein A2X36_11085 [Elusimicrobia bacterium GWA2_69_24]HBL17357.1 hypothetical protein [Elusimicrobiota bacterium]